MGGIFTAACPGGKCVSHTRPGCCRAVLAVKHLCSPCAQQGRGRGASPAMPIPAGELRAVSRAGGGVSGVPGLVPNFPLLLPLPWQALGGEDLSFPVQLPSRTMPGLLGLGQLLAVMILVLQPTGTLGECPPLPSRLLGFLGSAFLSRGLWEELIEPCSA